MKLHCSNGCTPPYKTEHFEREPHETHCDKPGCDGRLRDQSDAESRAAEEFHQIVVSLGCWAKENREGHICTGHVQAHHVIEAQWWRRAFGDLPEEKLIALIYDPVIGAPLCGGFHAAITPSVGGKRDTIYFHELDRELIEHCERLDLEYPGRGVLARLRLECPVGETVNARG